VNDPDNHIEKSRIDLLCTLSGALFDIYLRAPVQVHSWLFSSSSMTPMWKKMMQKIRRNEKMNLCQNRGDQHHCVITKRFLLEDFLVIYIRRLVKESIF